MKRGEDPKRIRIVDLRPPSRLDLQESLASGVDLVKANVTDLQSIHSAFTKPWLETISAEPEITVFNTAAVIRVYERHASLVPSSAKVNVDGTQNVIDASRACGATILCATSSGSVVLETLVSHSHPGRKNRVTSFKSFVTAKTYPTSITTSTSPTMPIPNSKESNSSAQPTVP